MIQVDNNDGKIRVKVKGRAIDIMSEAATLLTSIVGNALTKGVDEASVKSIYSTIIHMSYDFILEEHGIDMLPCILAAATEISKEVTVQYEDDGDEEEDDDAVWSEDTSLADEVKKMMKDKGVMF